MKKSLLKKEIWQWPIVIALISLIGLTVALFGDGIWDKLSWIALSVPILVCLWFLVPHKFRLFG